MKKHEICCTILSLENEIEFLKEVKEPTIKKKRELNKLYKALEKTSNLERESQDETFDKHMAFNVS
jgi:hypothetical protein